MMTSPPDPPVTPQHIPLVVAEYSALREEILKRIEMQHQLISLALAAPATFVGFGIAIKSATLILLYPILATCLSIAWSNHEIAIMRVGNYIQEKIENRVNKDIQWEHYMYEEVHKHLLTRKLNLLELFWSRILALRGIFLVTQIIPLLIGVIIGLSGLGPSLWSFLNMTNLLLAVIDAACMFFTFYTLRQYPSERKPKEA